MGSTANADGPNLGGVSETMLQTLYARAKESRKPNHKIYDAKAVEVVGQLSYDFSAADKDTTMSIGVIARTILLDAMVSGWLATHPAATVVNIASGMDTRFYRINSANVRRWYNVDLPEAIRMREHYITEDTRVTNVGCSAMDERWANEVYRAERANQAEKIERNGRATQAQAMINETGGGCENTLIIVEGFSMYLSEQEVRQLLSIIDRYFSRVTVFFEILSPRFVHKDIEKSISRSGATFTFGAKSGDEIARLCPTLTWRGDRSLVEGMEVIMPVYKIIGKIPAVRGISNKIVVLEK